MVQNFPNKYQNKLISQNIVYLMFIKILNYKKILFFVEERIKKNVKVRLGSTQKFSNKILEYERNQWN